MPRTDAQHLAQLKVARDEVIDKINSGVGVISYSAGDIRITRPTPGALLAAIEEEIKRYERKLSSDKRRGGRSVADFQNWP